MNNQQPRINPQHGQRQIQIKITDEVLKGVYANAVQASHTKEEFILDFMNLFPPQGIVNARIIMSPGHMKRFTKVLEENIKKYENAFGKIKEAKMPEGGKGSIGFLHTT